MSTMTTFAAIPPLSKDSGSWAPKGLSFPLLNIHVCGSLQSRRGMMSGAAATENLDQSGMNRMAPGRFLTPVQAFVAPRYCGILLA